MIVCNATDLYTLNETGLQVTNNFFPREVKTYLNQFYLQVRDIKTRGNPCIEQSDLTPCGDGIYCNGEDYCYNQVCTHLGNSDCLPLPPCTGLVGNCESGKLRLSLRDDIFISVEIHRPTDGVIFLTQNNGLKNIAWIFSNLT